MSKLQLIETSGFPIWLNVLKNEGWVGGGGGLKFKIEVFLFSFVI
jgi:hypothetical protein